MDQWLIFATMAESAAPSEITYAETSFVVLAQVPGGKFPRREAYVVARPTAEAAEAVIRQLYQDEVTPIFIVLPMPVADTSRLRLEPGEILPWQ